MINLLPPDVKEQVRYAKLNRLTLRYLRVLLAVVVVLAVVFAGTFYLLQQQSSAVAADVADKKETIDSLNKTFTPKAKEVSDRLAAVKYVQGTQTRFSAVIADIAKVVPKGVSIDSMTLTGNDKAPVKMVVSAQSYQLALAFRNALTTSPRVANVDLETIAASQGGLYSAAVIVAFKPGMAK